MADAPPPYASYPRQNYQTSPYGRPPGVYIEAIGDAWNLVKSDLTTWVAASLIFFVVAGAMYAVTLALVVFLLLGGNMFATLPTETGEMIAYQLKSLVLSLPLVAVLHTLIAGLQVMGVRQASGQAINPGMVFQAFPRLLPILGVTVLMQIAITLGAMACIVPAFFLTGAFALAPMICVMQGKGAIESMSLSFKTLGNGSWMMFLVYFIASIAASLGVCACGFGLLVTLPLFAVTIGLHYYYFFPPQTPAYVPVADESTWGR